MLDGNPADSTLAVELVERQIELYGRPPRQASLDGAFASGDNLEELKSRGVKDAVFAKGKGLKVSLREAFVDSIQGRVPSSSRPQTLEKRAFLDRN